MIWSPENSQKRKQEVFYIWRKLGIEFDRYCDILKYREMYKLEIF